MHVLFQIMLYAYYLNDYIAMQTLTSQIIVLVTLDSLWIDYLPTICHFHMDHNAPCLPPKFCITIVFDFSWDKCNTQKK